MRYTAVIAILVISVFLMGCAQKEISAIGEKEYQDTKSASSSGTSSGSKSAATETKTYTVETKDNSSAEQHITVQEQGKDSSVTFKKLDTYTRDKGLTEKCDLPYPLECVKYLAKDGVIYLTIKNAGYESKLDQVTLTLDNDYCDPTETYIETGQNKDFECYADANADYVSGTLDMEYYKPIGNMHDSKVGQLVVLME